MAPVEIEMLGGPSGNDKKAFLGPGAHVLLTGPLGDISVKLDAGDVAAEVRLETVAQPLGVLQALIRGRVTTKSGGPYRLEDGESLKITPPEAERPAIIVKKMPAKDPIKQSEPLIRA